MPQNADLTAVIDGDTKGLAQALGAATDQLKNFDAGAGQTLKHMDEMFTSVFGNMEAAISHTKTALAAAAPVALFSFLHSEIQKGIEEFKKIGDEADKAKVGTNFLQEMGYAANAANVSFAHITSGLNEFAIGLGKLKADQGDLKKHLEGTNAALLEQLKGAKNAEAGVRLMADAIAKIKDPFAQAKLAGDAFGKSNSDIYKVLNEGAAGMQRAADAARNYGVIVDENVIRYSQEAKTGFEAVSKVVETQFRMALLNIAPVIKQVGDGMLWFSNAVRQTYDAFSSLEGVTSSGLEERIKSISATLIAQRDAIKSLQGGGGTFDRNVVSDWLFGTDEEQLARLKKGAEENIALLNKLSAEREKRSSASRTAPLDVPEAADDKSEENRRKAIEGQRAMDELMKRYYTDTHQFYEAIKADQDREVQRFKIMLEDHKITWQQYQVAMVVIAADTNAKIKNEQDKLSTTLRTSMQGVSSEFEKIFTSWQSGHAMSLQAIERDFVQMIERMVLKAAILEPLFGTGKAGSNEFGLIGGGVQSVFGSGGVSGSIGKSLGGLLGGGSTAASTAATGFGDAGSTFSGVYHEGGIVGQGGASRWVDSGVFEGAVRYHQGGIAGLMPGEMPAILQQGEGVLTQEQMQKGGAAGGGHTFITNIQSPNPQAFAESHGQIMTTLSQAVARGQRNL